MSTKSRIFPAKLLLMQRKVFLRKLRKVISVKPYDSEYLCLETGNAKLGREGKFYKSMFVWNLPSVATCPGASNWCLENCYNADDRTLVFPVERWAKNWWLYLNEPYKLRDRITEQLHSAAKPCAVRIHSSGDFFSNDYVNFWGNIIDLNKDVKFWAYTRSWIINDIRLSLENLRSFNNIELFASWDSTMRLPPPINWRKSYVFYNENGAECFCRENPNTLICLEQIDAVANCASCGICTKDLKKDIAFYFH